MGQEYDGLVNGTVELTDSQLIIRRKGVLGFLTQGLKGEKRIPYRSVTSVQFKAAGMLTNGYIQFGVAGGKESGGGILAATHDENTVMFRKAANEQFAHLRDAVESRAEKARGGGEASNRPSAIAELAQLAELHKQGILTDAEFSQQKARLLA